MSEYTTEELIKANRVHADLHAGCQECPLYEERVCTSPKLQTYSADRLEAQQKEISDLKKQIAETYTEKQYRKDSMRFCKVYAGDFCSKCPIKGAVMSELIEIISRKDKLLDFMERYNLIGLRDATEEQLREYIEEVLLA